MNSAVLLTYIRNNERPRTEPCDKPQFVFQAFEQLSLIITIWLLQIRHDDNMLSKGRSVPNYSNS